jgi:lysozyme
MSRMRKAGIGITAAGVMAIAAIGQHEGLRLVSYADVVGVWTACWGETKGIRAGMKFTKGQCDEMFIRRLDEFADGVERCVPAARGMPDARYIAHVSLAYNIGLGAYCKSSIARQQNAGNTSAACDAFLLYNKAGGVAWKGLTRRRQAEREMCRRGLA